MSQKWIRSKKWDDEHIPRALWPLKFVLRAFSSITLAVSLLTLVAVYIVLASVPVGLLALAPTYLIYGLTAVAAVAFIAVLPAWAGTRFLAALRVGPAGRFVVGFVMLLALSVAASWLWHRLVWPSLRYDALTGTGFRLFTEFVAANQGTTVRRLRGMEMSEPEFYAWWPLRVVLMLFISNMVFATVRRIEFTFKNIGVLTVHTGIVTLATGSMWYSALKEEGDMVLVSGELDARGMPTPGPTETGFYDNATVALWANLGREWDMRVLKGIPRYNDYNLDALGMGELADGSLDPGAGHALDFAVPPGRSGGGTGGVPNVDPGVKLRVVGYASFADLVTQHVKPDAPAARNGKAMGEPVWWLKVVAPGMGRRLPFWPTLARARMFPFGAPNPVLVVEFTKGMTQDRWRDLQAELPANAQHALVLEVNGQRRVVPVQEGTTAEFAGYKVQVRQLLAHPPFPLLSAGYEGSDSSVAVVHVTPPGNAKAFDRYVYHRFPEISQDLLEELNERGMPKRRDADKGIRIGYVDASVSQVYLDEVFGSEREKGGPKIRAILRQRGGKATVQQDLHLGSSVPIGGNLSLLLDERWDDSVEVETPMPVDAVRRDNKELGTHKNAALAVEVSIGDGEKAWRRVVWLPFAQYLFKEMDRARIVALPDGRQLVLAFGRMMRALPGLELQLKDFEMIPHPFGGPTQDFRSELVVHQVAGTGFTSTDQATSLNEPLLIRVPFRPREGVPAVANFLMRGLSVITPTQYKFSQAGWDAQGWNETQEEVAAGRLARPLARWTILGVGTNPGIYVIATGAVLMGLGIPWAFYVKPLLVRREKKKIQQRLAREKEAVQRQSEPEVEVAGVRS